MMAFTQGVSSPSGCRSAKGGRHQKNAAVRLSRFRIARGRKCSGQSYYREERMRTTFASESFNSRNSETDSPSACT